MSFDIENIDIERLYDEAKQELFQPVEHIDFVKQCRELSYNLSESILNKIDTSEHSFIVFDILEKMLGKGQIPVPVVQSALDSVRFELEKRKAEELKTKEPYQALTKSESDLIRLKVTAVTYLKKIIYRDLESRDLAQKLTFVKSKLDTIDPLWDVFVYAAYEEIEKELTKQISAELEEKQLREELNEGANTAHLEKRSQAIPPYRRERIINAAVLLTETKDRWKIADLASELVMDESALKRLMRQFGLTKPKIIDEAKEKIRLYKDRQM